jgi:SAM-dependent methyltransferase
VRIDLGGGTAPKPGFVNLDPVHGDYKIRAQDPWPFLDYSADAIWASHVMEHIPAGAERIAVFNEAHRVLKPGGTFTVIVPLFPWPQAMADPTHVSYWVEESFGYFDGRCPWGPPNADYGILPWEHGAWYVRDGWEGTWVGVKPGHP